MVATLWKDERPVAVLSTNAQPEMGGCSARDGAMLSQRWGNAQPEMGQCSARDGAMLSQRWGDAQPEMGGCSARDGGMLSQRWGDAQPEMGGCSARDGGMLSQRWGEAERKAPGGKKQVAVSKPVLADNTSMGGGDPADQHHSYYPVGRPSVRSW